MKKLDKQLAKTVENLIKMSFDNKGELVEKNVERFADVLKSLPFSKAAPALSRYLEGIKQEVYKRTLEVESFLPLTDEQVEEITRQMRSEYQINQVETNLDSSLLGGIKVKIGDVLYDDSVGRKILQLKEAIRD